MNRSILGAPLLGLLGANSFSGQSSPPFARFVVIEPRVDVREHDVFYRLETTAVAPGVAGRPGSADTSVLSPPWRHYSRRCSRLARAPLPATGDRGDLRGGTRRNAQAQHNRRPEGYAPPSKEVLGPGQASPPPLRGQNICLRAPRGVFIGQTHETAV